MASENSQANCENIIQLTGGTGGRWYLKSSNGQRLKDSGHPELLWNSMGVCVLSNKNSNIFIEQRRLEHCKSIPRTPAPFLQSNYGPCCVRFAITLYVMRWWLKYFSCNGRVATNLPWHMPFPFKYFLSFKHWEAEIFVCLGRKWVTIIAEVCHQVVISLADAY